MEQRHQKKRKRAGVFCGVGGEGRRFWRWAVRWPPVRGMRSCESCANLCGEEGIHGSAPGGAMNDLGVGWSRHAASVGGPPPRRDADGKNGARGRQRVARRWNTSKGPRMVARAPRISLKPERTTPNPGAGPLAQRRPDQKTRNQKPEPVQAPRFLKKRFIGPAKRPPHGEGGVESWLARPLPG